MKTITVLDDHPLLLEGVVSFLNNQKGYRVYPFLTEQLLSEFLGSTKVDLVLVDMQLSDRSGLDVCLRLKKLYSSIPVVALSNLADRNLIFQFMQNGGNGYILKDVANEEFLRCVRLGLEGREALCDRAKELYTGAVSTLRELPRLTQREKEILIMISNGYTSNQIAEKLFLSPVTIETHRRNLLTKFKVKNMIELVQLALKHNLLGL
ncbi:response regulator transcription factor [Sphingobacterium sp. N143]|uniref:response regulator transcription factor n=1 Tax=Sphingobacterium sp. N143 TaxID=2746727 RepID=UPI0025772581|nr:response regulator transcription factor [Sphingobacterium sp. N143]MDM1294142.1 response regulator transcription factor [Sphingobacterium sp. N143]